MVLDTAKLKNRKSTILPGMRGRDAAKELTLKVNISAWNAWKRCCKNVDIQGDILQVFTIVFSETESIVNHNS